MVMYIILIKIVEIYIYFYLAPMSENKIFISSELYNIDILYMRDTCVYTWPYKRTT